MPTLAVVAGDGIGREVVPAALDALSALRAPFELRHFEAGWERFEASGSALDTATFDAIAACDGVLFGAVASPSGPVEGYSSPILDLRHGLELYANLRPSLSAPLPGSREGVDLLIVRENTECLYSRRERLEDQGDTAIAERVITRRASERIARVAFEQAERRRGRREAPPRVTVVHKANVLRLTDGLFRDCARSVAAEFPAVEVEEQLVDSFLHRLILEPERYDVIVAPNLYGDLASDAAAALVGGLGVAASGNIGERHILVEPVHGSAPDIAGQGIANPVATLRSLAMLLEHFGLSGEAQHLHRALTACLSHGPRTPDLGGSASTTEVTAFVVDTINRQRSGDA